MSGPEVAIGSEPVAPAGFRALDGPKGSEVDLACKQAKAFNCFQLATRKFHHNARGCLCDDNTLHHLGMSEVQAGQGSHADPQPFPRET